MVTNPEQEFRKIYKFIEEPYFNHRFQNLNQININGLSYDDTVVGSNMHTFNKERIEKKYNPYIEKIPQKIKRYVCTH